MVVLTMADIRAPTSVGDVRQLLKRRYCWLYVKSLLCLCLARRTSGAIYFATDDFWIS